MRRLRRGEGMRALVAETRLAADDFICPFFVRPGVGVDHPIVSMPGVSQYSVDNVLREIEDLAGRGLRSIILFGIPARKDAEGSPGWDPAGPVPEAIRAVKRRFPEIVVMADVCLCEYTDHGHCGPLAGTGDGATVDNEAAVAGYVKAALCYADAGADFVAPSGMMDGTVAALRSALDASEHAEVGIMAYSAKYASHYYGPFRDAAESPPKFGDRRSYQMDPANAREAMTEIALDIEEGADIVMVKPALSYLDIIRAARDRFELPIAAYNVSGEFSMLKAAVERKLVGEEIILETLLSIRRAGADLIISYFTPELLRSGKVR